MKHLRMSMALAVALGAVLTPRDIYAEPARPRDFGPGELASRKVRKRAKALARARIKAGIPGSKLARKAAGGKL